MRSSLRTTLFDLPEFSGKSNEEIAKVLGVHRWTVGRIRNNAATPGQRFIKAAMEKTGRPFEELFYDSKAEQPKPAAKNADSL